MSLDLSAATAAAKRVYVVSDTHGHITAELLERLQDADVIVHAGDICSPIDLDSLNAIAPTYLALGNNDWAFEYHGHNPYGIEGNFEDNLTMTLFGLRWEVCHYRERLRLKNVDIAICGHTHRPYVERQGGLLLMNPGSTTYPRTSQGPTFGCIRIVEGEVADARIFALERKKARRTWY
jgi:putative phosphoesterase